MTKVSKKFTHTLLKIDPETLLKIEPELLLKIQSQLLLKIDLQTLFTNDPQMLIKIGPRMLLKSSSTKVTRKVFQKPYSNLSHRLTQKSPISVTEKVIVNGNLKVFHKC